MSMGTAKAVGAAGVTAAMCAAGLAGLDLFGVRLPQAQYADGMYLMLLAVAIGLIGAACLQAAFAHASSRNVRAARAAFTAGVDYGLGTRARASVRQVLDEAA